MASQDIGVITFNYVTMYVKDSVAELAGCFVKHLVCCRAQQGPQRQYAHWSDMNAVVPDLQDMGVGSGAVDARVPKLARAVSKVSAGQQVQDMVHIPLSEHLAVSVWMCMCLSLPISVCVFMSLFSYRDTNRCVCMCVCALVCARLCVCVCLSVCVCGTKVRGCIRQDSCHKHAVLV